MEEPKTDNYLPTGNRMRGYLIGIIYLPFAVARALLLPTLFLGNLIRRMRNRYLFRARTDDIFIVSYPKSGTTWMQMILYQLTTPGQMDFEHINEVSPWLESVLLFPDPKFNELPSPRLIKSHWDYSKIPKFPCRYIYIARDGRDAAVSFFHQYRDLFGMNTRFPKFFQRFMAGRVQYGSWFTHVARWFENADGLNLLFITYEDMKRDPGATIRRIADFCGIPPDEDRFRRVLERSSFQYMRACEEKFGPQFRAIDGSIKKTRKKSGQFIRRGKSGGWCDYFDEPMLAQFQTALQSQTSLTGLYDDNT